MADDEVNVKIKGDSKSFVNASKKAQKSSSKLSSVVGKGATIATAAFAALAGVISGALISSYKEQEQAEIRTRQTLESTGHAAGMTANELFTMASSLQEVTTYGDEAIIGAQNLLLTFKQVGSETFPRATEAILDVATAMGMDLKSAALQVGKALNDPRTGLTMLTRVGITFTDEQKNMIKQMSKAGKTAEAQGLILDELESQFGGAAKAAAQGTGEMQQFMNVIGDIGEKGGGALVMTLLKISEALNLPDVAKYWNQQAEEMTGANKSAEQLRFEMAKLNKDIMFYNKELEDGAGKWLYENLGKYEQDLNRYANLTASKAGLAKELAAAEKKELLNSAEYKAEILAKQQRAAKIAAAEEIENTEIARKLKEEAAVIHDEGAAAERQKKLDGDKLSSEESLQLLRDEVAERAEIKAEEKINELIAKEEFDEAELLLEQNKIDKRLAAEEKAKKQKSALIAFERKMSRQRIDIASKTALLMTTIFGEENKAAFLIAKGAAVATATVDYGKAQMGTLAASRGLPVGVSEAYLAQASALNKISYGLSLATISASAIKGFAQGGVIGGISGGAIAGGDDTFATVKKGEMVLNADQQRQVFEAFANGGNSQSSGELSGDIQITFDADEFMDAFEAKVITMRQENRTAI